MRSMTTPSAPTTSGASDQRDPVVDAELVQPIQRHERAQHVQRAVGEVDDAEQAEDDRQAQAQHRVERAVDQPEQQLAEKGLDRNPEDAHRAQPALGRLLVLYFQSAQLATRPWS